MRKLEDSHSKFAKALEIIYPWSSNVAKTKNLDTWRKSSVIYNVMRVMQTLQFMRFPSKGALKYFYYTTEVSPILDKLFARKIFQHTLSTFWDWNTPTILLRSPPTTDKVFARMYVSLECLNVLATNRSEVEALITSLWYATSIWWSGLVPMPYVQPSTHLQKNFWNLQTDMVLWL